jgi:hypothetical protein
MFEYEREIKEIDKLREEKEMNTFKKVERAMEIVSPLLIPRKQKIESLKGLGLNDVLLEEFFAFMESKIRKPNLVNILESVYRD